MEWHRTGIGKNGRDGDGDDDDDDLTFYSSIQLHSSPGRRTQTVRSVCTPLPRKNDGMVEEIDL